MTDIAKISEFIVEHFLSDVNLTEIDPDFDLIDTGVIDSLGLLRLISWLSSCYELSLDDIPITPERFRTIHAIESFVVDAKSVIV
jgi:acyl carrier protein